MHRRENLKPEDRSIAVLPFESLSPKPYDAFYATVAQDQITTGLGRVAAVKVISPESANKYPPGKRDPTRIGSELGVRHLPEGTVRRDGGRMEVNVSLIDTTDPEHPWTKHYGRNLTDAFLLQCEITRAVLDRPQASLSPPRKTQGIDPDAGEVHLARANHLAVVVHDDAQAKVEIELARRTLPNSPLRETLAGGISSREGRWEDYVRACERAADLDPREADYLVQLEQIYRRLRRYDQANAKLSRLLTVHPGNHPLVQQIDQGLVMVESRADLALLRVAFASAAVRRNSTSFDFFSPTWTGTRMDSAGTWPPRRSKNTTCSVTSIPKPSLKDWRPGCAEMGRVPRRRSRRRAPTWRKRCELIRVTPARRCSVCWR